jgi:hypothetical protein
VNLTYYILGPDDTEQDVIDSSSNVLGEISLNTFHTEDGFYILMQLINQVIYCDDNGTQCDSLLDSIQIKDSSNNSLSIAEFLDSLQGLIIK